MDDYMPVVGIHQNRNKMTKLKMKYFVMKLKDQFSTGLLLEKIYGQDCEIITGEKLAEIILECKIDTKNSRINSNGRPTGNEVKI